MGVSRVVTSGNLGGVMVSTLTQNASNVGSIPALCKMFRIYITSMALVKEPPALFQHFIFGKYVYSTEHVLFFQHETLDFIQPFFQ